MIAEKKWDSDFFNLKIGEVNFTDCKDCLNFADFDLLYIVSDEDFDLQIDGFTNLFSEQKVKFHKKLSEILQTNENVFSHSEIEYNIQELYQLAFESGKHSRFLLDKNFGTEKFKELYCLWIDNSISKTFADNVFLYKNNQEIAGLLTYKTTDDNATVGLIAVSNKHQGKGIGSILLKHLETILYQKGITSLTIPTQFENKQACNFYSKQGYSIFENTFIKHYWKI
ncbi:GNAT family N-acetyltransferase [Flavobacterium solisilvae]|uniref:GNAT family N-acetyltransferase n=1 Tax=Flavobacterium solisilvae TaxID=1852019 RepID=A0ABX1QX93_9FLAO|nr:GNAT family N-acetyltransferase [Flavobacterium solisilvae]NMH25799.1 GNAT family N-acetyltransferase [Flavobacterium solisilvae]